jgi:hypothetical protein
MVKVSYKPAGAGVKPGMPAAPRIKPPVAKPPMPTGPVPAPTQSMPKMQAPPPMSALNKVSYNPTRPANLQTPNDRPRPQAPEILPQNPPAPIPGRDAPQRMPDPRPNVPPGDPNDPTNGRGQVPPPTNPTQAKVNKVRRHETTQERIDRLQAMRKAGNRNPKLDGRIQALKGRKRAGEVKPKDKPGDPKKQPVQLDDKPETYPDRDHKRRNRNQSENLAELALPRGMDTIFYDNPAGDEQNKEAVKQKQGLQKDLAKEAADKNFVPDDQQDQQDNKDVRGGENLQQRRKRLQAALAKLKPGDPKRAQLEARIADLEKRIKKGDTKGRNKNQPGTPKRPYRNREVSYRPLGYGGELRI